MAKESNKIIPEITVSERKEYLPEVNHIPGNYLLTQKDGIDISVTPKDYKRAYSNNPDFTVKKSPNE